MDPDERGWKTKIIHLYLRPSAFTCGLPPLNKLLRKFQGKAFPMILHHEKLRRAAKGWRAFSSDAPMRVPFPSEEQVRSIHQLPLASPATRPCKV